MTESSVNLVPVSEPERWLNSKTRRVPVHGKESPSVAAMLQCTNLGGMEKVAYNLFEKLQARGINFRISSPRPWGSGRNRVLGVDPDARAFDYRGKYGWRSFQTFRAHSYIQSKASDHVWVIGTCASCLRAARQAGLKTILSHHYHHFEGRWSRIKWTAFYLIFGAGLDVITYPTEFTRNEALRIAPWLRRKMKVVRNGFAVHYTTEARRLELRHKARTALGIPHDTFVVGNGGWLIPRKRFDVFLHTAQKIASCIPKSVFYICGGGPEEQRLRQLSRNLGISHRVCFTGWMQDLTPYYQAWDAVLFNSDFDALGATPLEAASHGCSCVASCRYGGLSEFLKDGETGFFMEDHNPERLADDLCELARNPSLALTLRQNAVARLEREFSDEAALKFYEDYFCNNNSD